MPLEFTPVTREHRCPVCQKDTWCEVGNRSVLCQRVESDHPNQSKNCGGYYHFFEDNTFKVTRWVPSRPKLPAIDVYGVILRCMDDPRTEKHIAELGPELGMHWTSLLRLDACWSREHSATAFPMRDGSRQIIGIRLRANDGRKWAITGSRSGLFIPDCAHDLKKEDTVLICEGPTDTAAGLTLGFQSIGKPCCNSGNDYVIELLARMKPSRVVIVSDVDSMQVEGIGFKEALKLQAMIKQRSVVWAPQAKDLREFLKFGGTRQLIESEIGKMLWKKQ